MYKRIIFCVVCFFEGMQMLPAQDPVFSQPFLSPINLNPAATGSGEYDLRFSAIYRRQWWAIPSSMHYTAFSVDKFIPSIGSGFGALVTTSSEGYLKKTGIYGSYSWTFCPVGTVAENWEFPKWFVTGGIQYGMVQRRIDYGNLVFADQLNVDGYIPGSITAANTALKNGDWYPDFASGLFFSYNTDEFNRVLVGASAHHLNRPDESLTSTSNTFRSQLPVHWTGNFMFTHTNTEKEWSYTVAAIGYLQQNNRSVQVGSEVTQNKYDISLGLWYRGNVNFKNMNTVALTLSVNLIGRNSDKSRIRAGVAHDAIVGGNGFSYTTGASEIGFVYDQSTYQQEPKNKCKPRITGQSACPIRESIP